MKRATSLGFLLLAAACSSGCRSATPTAERLESLDAVAWFQTAEEVRQIQRSIFASAMRALSAALADPSWRALDQPADAVDLPPAVIVDVDETLLDNSPFQVDLLREGESFGHSSWSRWVHLASAPAIPGALEFATFAEENGVSVFYVTNRDAEFEEATRRNLSRAGFPVPAEPDVVLMRGERPDWASDKEGRRRLVASSYRVLLLIGDDLNDFMSGTYDASLAERSSLAAEQAARFGTAWFVLPNPLYGSWRRALVEGLPERSGPDAVVRQMLGRLRGAR